MNRQFSVLECLRAGIPLSLLLDLASPDGPDSRDIARRETGDARTA